MEDLALAKHKSGQIERVNEICDIFMRAETIIKRIERIDDGMIVPAINQLRYAGHHFVKFSAEIKPNESHDIKCINHCYRAIYDAYEAGITYCLLQLKTFQDDYRKTVITDVFTDYAECCCKANEANELVKATLKADCYEKSCQGEEYFEAMFVFIQKLPAIRDELNKKIYKERISFYILMATFIVACVGVVVTVVK